MCYANSFFLPLIHVTYLCIHELIQYLKRFKGTCINLNFAIFIPTWNMKSLNNFLHIVVMSQGILVI